MDKGFLDRLYFGKIVPWEHHNRKAPEMQVVSRKLDNDLNRLYELLDDESRKLLDQLMSSRADLESISVCEAFKEGFRLGAEFTMDTFCSSKQM